MTDLNTHINTLRARVPEETAQQVRLRLSTTLGGADLHPPGLAPSQVLLVRELSDPKPGRLGLQNAGAGLDRTWERAAREVLADCLRRAVRPTNGRVPPDAEALLFDDAAEAWACWVREQVVGASSAATPWWTESLEASADEPIGPTAPSRPVAAVGQARPRLVPALIAHLAAWERAAEVVGSMAASDADALLRVVCEAFEGPPPPRPRGSGEEHDEEATFRPDASTSGPEAGQSDPQTPPWTAAVNAVGGEHLAEALGEQSPAHRQLVGVGLVLTHRPEAVRTRSFRAAWRTWRRTVRPPTDAPERSGESGKTPSGHRSDADFSGSGEKGREGRGAEMSADGEALTADDDSSENDDAASDEHPASERDATTDRESRDASPEEAAADGEAARADDATSAHDHVEVDTQPTSERAPTAHDERRGPPREEAGAATALGGVFYLVNVLDALDLPAVVETPPVGAHVGAWAALEALARTLLTEPDAVRPHDPLWRVLATLDGRRPEAPAGRVPDDHGGDPEAYRMPSAWLEAPLVEEPVDGQWAVRDGRLRVWTDLGCVADLATTDDPAAQAEAEWASLPNTGRLRPAASDATMPTAPEPDACAPTLARWAARATPYVRSRITAALGGGAADVIADLLAVDARLYVTDLNVDIVCPLNAADLSARVAGLDRSPGWWAAGGRIVRIHFQEATDP